MLLLCACHSLSQAGGDDNDSDGSVRVSVIGA